MAKYDGEVLKGYANGLYTRAWILTIPYALAGALAGFVLQAVFAKYHVDQDQTPAVVWALVLGTMGVLVGYFKGEKYRIQAQLALCAVEQEKHLRVLASK
jgi:ABC-type Mn2+/Zn2+ transport system permease subunit